MKTKLLVIIFATLLTQSYAQTTSQPFIKTFLYDSIRGERTLICDQQLVESIITKKRVMVNCSAISIDLKIIKKGLGDSGSWLGVTSDSTYYYITVNVEGSEYAVFFQPTDEKLNRVDLPFILIANYDICER